MVNTNTSFGKTPNPGYCEFCGPDCKHCFGDPLTRSFPPARKDVHGVIGGLAFDNTVGKWVCAADYDYEANRNV